MSTMKFTSWQDLDGNEVANSAYPPGLVLIKSQDIASGVSSVTVNDCFSSDYDNYKILIDANTSVNTVIEMKLNGVIGSTDYDSKAMYIFVYASGGWVETLVAGSSAWRLGWVSNNTRNGCNVDVYGPYLGNRVHFSSNFSAYVSGFSAGRTVATSGTQSTGFTILPTSGTLNSGTIRVYGYNQ